MNTRNVCPLLFAIALSMFGVTAWAQIRSGAITGLVTDKTGAVVPNAEVSAINEETQVVYKAKTGGAGEYVVPYLAPGRYTVTVEVHGFGVFKVTGVVLGTGQQSRVDAQLQPGSVVTTVEVRAELAALQTESTSLQDRVNARTIEAIPNVNHNPYYFATLQPGVVPRDEMLKTTDLASFGIGVNARPAVSAVSVNGGQAFTSDLTVDGVNVQGGGWNEAAVLPNPDGVQEVRTITNNYSAEYGRAQGVIAITTKSGANAFHGSAFDRIRNEALNANTFQNNAQGLARPPFKVNYYGGTLGGPIVKDKAFFFVSYQGLLHNDAEDWLLRVPTPAEKQGNFSQTLVDVDGVPTPVQIFNPYSVTQVGPNLFQRAVYPNAIITNPDPFALKLYSYYPDPNRTPIDVYNDGNYFHRGERTFRSQSLNTRVDYHRGQHSIYGTGGFMNGTIVGPSPWGNSQLPFYIRPTGGTFNDEAPLNQDRNPYAALGDTWILSPTLVADLRLGVQRINSIFGVNPVQFDYNSIGIPASIQAAFAVPGTAPDVIVSPWSNLSNLRSAHKHEFQTNYNLAGSMNKNLGKWTLKWGVEARIYHSNYQDVEEGTVQIVPGGACNTCGGEPFTAEYTDAVGNSMAQNVNATMAGLSAADLLTGAGALYIAPGRSPFPALTEKYLGLYSQNDWHVTRRLTVNLGLRWDLQPGPTERFNRVSSFDFSASNPFGSPGAIAFAGAGGYSRNLWDTHYNDLGPRVGAAYQLSETMVIRGGYGITYLPTNTGYFDGGYNYGMSSFSVFTAPLPYGTAPNGAPVGTFHDLAVSPVVTGTGANPAAPPLYGTGPTLFDRHNYLDGRLQQWNVAIEKRKGAWMFGANYSAAKGDRLPLFAFYPTNDVSWLSATVLNCYRTGTGCPAKDSAVTGNGYLQTGSNPAYDQVTNPFNPTGTLPFQGPLAQSTIPRYLADGPYPLFPGQSVSITRGFSDYESLTVQVQHAYSHGLQLSAFYTWSKSLDFTNTAAQLDQATDVGTSFAGNDFKNFNNNRKLSYSDVPHRFVATLVYDLPFGKGKAFGTQNRALQLLADDWRIGSVVMVQSGLPQPITGLSAGSLNARPRRVPGEPLEVPKALQHWYDGKTTVTLPDGRQITPCANCFLKYNVDAFAASVVPYPNNPGNFLPDIFWSGDAAIDYSSVRRPVLGNLTISLMRTFNLTERVGLEFQANVTNFLNKPQFLNYSMDLGSTNLTQNDATHTLVGQGSGSSSYGTHGLTTLDPRQIEFSLKLRF